MLVKSEQFEEKKKLQEEECTEGVKLYQLIYKSLHCLYPIRNMKTSI